MKSAIDTSVLLSVFNGEPDAPAWLDLLIAARRQGQLVICEVVYAELAPAFSSEDELEEILEKMGIISETISKHAAWHAGRVFRDYRDLGGPREHLIPDFIIAAHGELQADRLAAKDRGYFRRYFPKLTLLTT